MDPDEICPACEAATCWCCNAELRDACRRLRGERDEALALAERRRVTLEMQTINADQHTEGVESLRAEIQRLRGGIMAALDNLENGPEGALTAEGALRLALNGD